MKLSYHCDKKKKYHKIVLDINMVEQQEDLHIDEMKSNLQSRLQNEAISAAEQMLKMGKTQRQVLPKSSYHGFLQTVDKITNGSGDNREDNSDALKNSGTIKRGRPKGRKTTTHPSLARPRHPLSAYNIFFKDERQKMIDRQRTKESGDDVFTFSSLAKTIASRWKTLDAKTMKEYSERAQVDKKRYQEQMEVYKRKLAIIKSEELKEKMAQDDNRDEEKKSTKANVSTQAEYEDEGKVRQLQTSTRKRHIVAATTNSEDGAIDKRTRLTLDDAVKIAKSGPYFFGGYPNSTHLLQEKIEEFMERGYHHKHPLTLQSFHQSPGVDTGPPATGLLLPEAALAPPFLARQTPLTLSEIKMNDILRKKAMELENAKRLVEKMQYSHDVALQAASMLNQQQDYSVTMLQHRQSVDTPRSSFFAVPSRRSGAALESYLEQQQQCAELQELEREQQRVLSSAADSTAYDGHSDRQPWLSNS